MNSLQDYHHVWGRSDTGGFCWLSPWIFTLCTKNVFCKYVWITKLLDTEHVEFLGCTFAACMPVSCAQPGKEKVSVEVDFNQIILQDNIEDGARPAKYDSFCISWNHYHLTVLSDWDELVYVDTNDVWDDPVTGRELLFRPRPFKVLWLNPLEEAKVKEEFHCFCVAQRVGPLPYVLFSAVFVGHPLLLIVVYAFTDDNGTITLSNFSQVLYATKGH